MKYLLITGASGNLGRELINYLDLNNYEKIFLTLNSQKVPQSIEPNDKFVYLYDYDLTDEDSVKEIFEKILCGKEDLIFILHLVGGYSGGKYFWEYSKNDLQALLDKNLFTSFLIAKYGLLKAKEAGGGSILFISARLSLEYELKRSIYALSKNALNYLVKLIEKEAKEFNFSANAIAPYIILTDESKKWINERNFMKCTSPQDIAKLVNYIFENYERYNGNIIITNDKF